MESTSGLFNPGGGADAVSVVRNRYVDNLPVRGNGYSGGVGAAGFEPYNRGQSRNYFCYNHGITLKQWYRPTTIFYGNSFQNGERFYISPIASPAPGVPVEVAESAPVRRRDLLMIGISSKGSVKEGAEYDVIVRLSSESDQDFPFYLHVVGGDFGALRPYGKVLVIPAGQASVIVKRAVAADHAGRVTLQARPLCSETVEAVETEITVEAIDEP
jgi:hypothetical protein